MSSPRFESSDVCKKCRKQTFVSPQGICFECVMARLGPPSAEDRAAARRQAVEVARLLDSKVISDRFGTSMDEPRCSYRIPFHAGDFWFKVLVSDTDFVFKGEHRSRDGLTSHFGAAMKRPWETMRATTQLTRVSEALGVAVYSHPSIEATVALHLLTPAVSKLIQRLDFAPLQRVCISSIQISAISELVSPEHCAQQVRLLRELLLTIYQEALGAKTA